MVSSNKVAVVRGMALDEEAKKRGVIISSLLCQGQVNAAAANMLPNANMLDIFTKKGLLWQHDGKLVITEAGRPYARHIACLFDQFAPGAKQLRRNDDDNKFLCSMTE